MNVYVSNIFLEQKNICFENVFGECWNGFFIQKYLATFKKT